MKKFTLCIVSFLVSAPLSAGISGLSIGATGGVEMLKINASGAEHQTFTRIGLAATISPSASSISYRGGLEYAWKSYPDKTKFYDIFILLGIEHYITPPLLPTSFYLGISAEISTFGNNQNESVTDFGVLVYGGINLGMGMMAVFAETGYGILFADLTTYSHIPIRGGIRVSL
jgi:hypothetical protein